MACSHGQVRRRVRSDERFTPRIFIDWVAAQWGLQKEDFGVAPAVVISWSRRVIESLAEAVGAEASKHWYKDRGYPLYTGEVGGHRVSFAYVPVGSPGTIMFMEEMVACGARAFIGFGWAGSLQPRAPVGTFLIPTSCIREEGTSFHYLGRDVTLGPSPRLVEILKDSCRAEGAKVLDGPLWTTDAVYRELVPKIQEYGHKGVLGVDMETSAMYALGQFRDVEVCNLLIVSDELWKDWKPAFGSQELREAGNLGMRIILRSLERGIDRKAPHNE